MSAATQLGGGQGVTSAAAPYAYVNNNFVGRGGYYYRCSWINGYRRCGLRID
jgi:hypothetical protein